MSFLLALALADDAPQPPPRVAVVVDRSRSMGEEGWAVQRAFLEALDAAHPDASWAVMGSDVTAQWLVEPWVDTPSLPDVPLRHGSELPAAIALARVHEEPPTHVVAITDGRFSQRLPPEPPPADGAPVTLVVWTEHADAVALPASYAPGGRVLTSADPATLAPHVLDDGVPTPEAPATEATPSPSGLEEVLVAAVRSVVDGCLARPRHRLRLAPVTVETTGDEIVYLDLSRVDEAYRWCLSGALFELELPAALQAAPSLVVEVDLRQ